MTRMTPLTHATHRGIARLAFLRTLPAVLILMTVGCGEPESESAASRPEDPTSPSALGKEAKPPVWLEEDAFERGLRFQLEATLASTPRLPEIVAGGGAALDFDDDGWMDVILCKRRVKEAAGSFATSERVDSKTSRTEAGWRELASGWAPRRVTTIKTVMWISL